MIFVTLDKGLCSVLYSRYRDINWYAGVLPLLHNLKAKLKGCSGSFTSSLDFKNLDLLFAITCYTGGIPHSIKHRSILVFLLTPNRHLTSWLYWFTIGLMLSVSHDSEL